MKIWIIQNRYRVLCSNGYSFGMDRYGHTYHWTYDPNEQLGREIAFEDLPAGLRDVVTTAERIGAPALAA